jgi:zona occludens toxin
VINLLLGPPGAGKSYEAVTYHVLPALLSGRKVITNLPLIVSSFIAYGIDPELIELRHATLENPKPFRMIDDYGSDWRGEGNIGPLYVIDECHKPLPKGMTMTNVEEWYAELRHEGADVLLITQSYGKISQAIRDMVQVVYRVRKATALGTDKRYFRKVQDGLRGEVMNEGMRVYNPARYVLYKSHTKSMGAVFESKASDLKPIWQHWAVIGSAILVPIGFIASLYFGAQMFFPSDSEVLEIDQVSTFTQLPSPTYAPNSLSVVPNSSTDSPDSPVVEKTQAVKHPFSGLRLHVRGFIKSEVTEKKIYLISASQNGQHVFNMNDNELLTAGYSVKGFTPCLLEIKFDKFQEFITCNSPSQRIDL